MSSALTFLGVIMILLGGAAWMIWGRAYVAARKLEREFSRETVLWLRAYTTRRQNNGPRFPPPGPETPREHPRRNDGRGD